MKQQVTLDEKEITQAIDQYLSKKGYATISVRIEVERGDPGDPRESGHRRAYAEVEVERNDRTT